MKKEGTNMENMVESSAETQTSYSTKLLLERWKRTRSPKGLNSTFMRKT